MSSQRLWLNLHYIIVAPDPNFFKVASRHLNSEFGDRFCVLTANSGAEAISVIKQLKQNHQSVALFMVEQQMPEMTGIEFLEQAIEFPEAKRVLLTDVDADARSNTCCRSVPFTQLW